MSGQQQGIPVLQGGEDVNQVLPWRRRPPGADEPLRALLAYDDELSEYRDDTADDLRRLTASFARTQQHIAHTPAAAARAVPWHRRLQARAQARRELDDAARTATNLISRSQLLEARLTQADTQLRLVEQQLYSRAGEDPLLVSRIAARSRSYSGTAPDGVIVYPTAAEFAAEDGRRATRAYDRASEAENRTILSGSDWGYRWRLEMDSRRSHHSEWRLSWTGTGEFYAACLKPDVRTLTHYSEEPVWLITSLAPAGDNSAEMHRADWLYDLERHQDERNSLLVAVDVLHQRFRPAER